jgi:hypothetical protein
MEVDVHSNFRFLRPWTPEEERSFKTFVQLRRDLDWLKAAGVKQDDDRPVRAPYSHFPELESEPLADDGPRSH